MRAEARDEQERYLLDGLAESLARGHYRVALRRYFMLARMAASGRAWAAMVSRRGSW